MKKNLIFWFGHLIVCFLVTWWLGVKAGIVFAITIELAQLEAFIMMHYKYSPIKKILKNYYWTDTVIDLFFDAIGIYLAYLTF